MEQQSGRGWYDIGGGMAGMWDGARWTGERISHEQLRAMTRPAAPPPPMVPPAPVGRVGPPPQRRWAVAAAVGAVVVVALIIAGAVANGDNAGQAARTTRTIAAPDPPLELTRAKREAAEACRLEESNDWFIGVPVPLSGTVQYGPRRHVCHHI